MHREFVFHVDQTLHERAKEYCRTKNFKMKDWVERVLRKEMDGEPPTQVELNRTLKDMRDKLYTLEHKLDKLNNGFLVVNKKPPPPL